MTGSSVTLEWTAEGAPVVRRNGSWLDTPPADATSYVDTSPVAGATYLVRTRIGNAPAVDTDCVLGGEAPSVCTTTATDTGVLLTWTVDGQVNLRKNGSWLSTVTNEQTFFDDAGNAGDTYIVRSNVTGSRVDHPCTN